MLSGFVGAQTLAGCPGSCLWEACYSAGGRPDPGVSNLAIVSGELQFAFVKSVQVPLLLLVQDLTLRTTDLVNQ